MPQNRYGDTVKKQMNEYEHSVFHNIVDQVRKIDHPVVQFATEFGVQFAQRYKEYTGVQLKKKDKKTKKLLKNKMVSASKVMQKNFVEN